VKDARERRLHNLVCAGKVDLQTAQHETATGLDQGLSEIRRQQSAATDMREAQFAPETAAESEVWVNTRSGKYFK
jgi:hypothetical protein